MVEWDHLPLPDRSWALKAQDASLRLLQSVAERDAPIIVGVQWIDQSLFAQFNDNRTEELGVFSRALRYLLDVVMWCTAPPQSPP